jgi:hypothetical protein
MLYDEDEDRMKSQRRDWAAAGTEGEKMRSFRFVCDAWADDQDEVCKRRPLAWTCLPFMQYFSMVRFCTPELIDFVLKSLLYR